MRKSVRICVCVYMSVCISGCEVIRGCRFLYASDSIRFRQYDYIRSMKIASAVAKHISSCALAGNTFSQHFHCAHLTLNCKSNRRGFSIRHLRYWLMSVKLIFIFIFPEVQLYYCCCLVLLLIVITVAVELLSFCASSLTHAVYSICHLKLLCRA